jgi:uncharacterized phiE125 gp8 family phage protein
VQQGSSGMIYWPPKAPGAVLDFAFDFSAFLQDGETISSKTVSATGVTVDSSAIAGSQVQLWLSAGMLGTPGIITCSITTSANRTEVETAIVPIGEEPVSLSMAKLQLKLEHDDDDDLVIGLSQAAREYVEKYCDIRLMAVAATMPAARFEDLERLAEAPVQSIAEITYLDAAGDEQTLDAAVYEQVNVAADPLRPMVRLKVGQSWPAIRSAVDAVRVSAVVGYTVVPQPIILAMLRLITQWYGNRAPAFGPNGELPHDVDALLVNYRR